MSSPAAERYGIRSDNKVVDYLLEHGPTPSQDLPTEVKSGVKRRVPLYRISASMHRPSASPTVWYLRDVHPPELVVRVVLEAYPDLLELRDAKITMMFSDHDDALAEAWQAIKHSYDNPR